MFITKNGVPISGKADLTSPSGKVATANIPVTGLKIVRDHVASVTNIREN